MELSSIVHLDSYRSRKDTRLRHAMALHGHDADKSRILQQLRRALILAEADRSAIVWLDEYGPGAAHAHVVLDLATDRPRRDFAATALAGAWDVGVPGLLDLPELRARPGDDGPGIRSLCAVALGSDGLRSWFLCVDSLTPRPSLPAEVTEDLMFVAGKCASILLHREPSHRSSGVAAGRSSGAGDGEGRFAGWPVLKDLQGLETDEETNVRITGRFLVARLLKSLLEDDLVVEPVSLGHQLTGVRREIGVQEGAHDEYQAWERVLDAAEDRDFRSLPGTLLEWGVIVERMGHLGGALEIHSMAFELAVVEGDAGAAVDAARFRGRVLRKLARWEDAVHWYGVAGRVAEETAVRGKLALVLDGLGNVFRDRGNLPRARVILGQVLAMGREAGDLYVQGVAHHDLMTVEKLAGDLRRAVTHGWEAVQLYEVGEGRLKALFDLAGVLKESGELDAAWDAYAVVAAEVASHEYRLMSVDGMAHVAALKGQRRRFESCRSRVDGMKWREASPVIQAQILLYRGLSLRALGRVSEAEEWLGRAVDYAEKHGLGQRIFEAERALDAVRTESRGGEGTAAEVGPDLGDGVAEVRSGLRRMRENLSGAVGPL